MIQASAAIDGEHLARALVAASEYPEWVDQIVEDAPAELLGDALRFITVDVVGALLDGARPWPTGDCRTLALPSSTGPTWGEP